MSYRLAEACAFLKYSDFSKSVIETIYSQRQRKYHNLNHINALLSKVPDLNLNDHNKRILVSAIIFHDYVYDIPSPIGLNEALSCVAYKDFHATRINPLDSYEQSQVIEAINATAYHFVDQHHISRSTKLMLDLDLSGFALSEEESLKLSDLVLAEYCDVVDKKTFMEANIKFLNTLLNRKQIFYIQEDWEKQARKNIIAQKTRWYEELHN